MYIKKSEFLNNVWENFIYEVFSLIAFDICYNYYLFKKFTIGTPLNVYLLCSILFVLSLRYS